MKTRVGIITYHRAHNFGAALQCYALQQTLRRIGYEPVVVDYHQPYIEYFYKTIRWDIMRRGLTNPRVLGAYLLKGLLGRFLKKRAYTKFRDRYLSCTHKVATAIEMPQDIGVYLVGSDQMWSLHCTGNQIDELYFGVFPRPVESKLCGYAISSTLRSLQEIGAETLHSYVKEFDKLSFREETICREVERMTQARAQVVLDPTLLLDGCEWESIAGKPRTTQKYLLTYFLHGGTDSPEFVSALKAYAQKIGCVVKDISSLALSPNDFLSAVKNASCIITSSFHATAFSLLFRKPFYSLKTGTGRDIRYSNLLEKLGIPARVIDINDLSSMDEAAINYDEVYRRLHELRKDSIAYLEQL